MDRKKVDQVIKIYLKDLAKKIKIDRAILFGSAATGKMGRDSDIDLLILSPDFAGMSMFDRFDLLIAARRGRKTQEAAMDIFGLTPEEYRGKSYSILTEIKALGREIFSTFPQDWQQHFWEVDLHQLDQKKHADFIIKRILERGNTSDILWLKKNYPREKFRHVLRKYRDLSRKTGWFWAKVLNIPPDEVMCLKTPYRPIPFGV